ncbi:hypothetical protein ACIRD2_33345 [Streptomyces sp. NPDC093595]|uniref:hypothetical protein n=1 Tax=Streptomyces sp. NPDC093595 TaxID=3366045 RepID=UPI00381506B9
MPICEQGVLALILGASLIAAVWLTALVLIMFTHQDVGDRIWNVAASLCTAFPVGVVTVSLTGKVWVSMLSAATGGAAVAILLLHGGSRHR